MTPRRYSISSKRSYVILGVSCIIYVRPLSGRGSWSWTYSLYWIPDSLKCTGWVHIFYHMVSSHTYEPFVDCLLLVWPGGQLHLEPLRLVLLWPGGQLHISLYFESSHHAGSHYSFGRFISFTIFVWFDDCILSKSGDLPELPRKLLKYQLSNSYQTREHSHSWVTAHI